MITNSRRDNGTGRECRPGSRVSHRVDPSHERCTSVCLGINRNQPLSKATNWILGLTDWVRGSSDWAVESISDGVFAGRCVDGINDARCFRRKQPERLCEISGVLAHERAVVRDALITGTHGRGNSISSEGVSLKFLRRGTARILVRGPCSILGPRDCDPRGGLVAARGGRPRAVSNDNTCATKATTVSLAGTVSDNVGGVSVTWTNDRGGRGAATFGTSSWSVSSIDLKNGPNLLTVTAADAARNTASAMLTVTSKVTGKK